MISELTNLKAGTGVIGKNCGTATG